MSTFKTVATFVVGVGAGLAIAYLLDPEGSKKRIAELKTKVGKASDMVSGKVQEYKGALEDMVEDYSTSPKR